MVVSSCKCSPGPWEIWHKLTRSQIVLKPLSVSHDVNGTVDVSEILHQLIWKNLSFQRVLYKLQRPHTTWDPKWWFSKGILLILGKSRLVKNYDLARIHSRCCGTPEASTLSPDPKCRFRLRHCQTRRTLLMSAWATDPTNNLWKMSSDQQKEFGTL